MSIRVHTLAYRAIPPFLINAKVGDAHQHVLVFYNGRFPNEEVRALNLANRERELDWK